MDYATAKDIVMRAYNSCGAVNSDIYFIYANGVVAKTTAADMRIFDEYHFRVIDYSTPHPHKLYYTVFVGPEIMFLTEQEAREYIVLGKLNQ